MNMYGGIPVIGESEFVVGTVLELREGEIIAISYFRKNNGVTGASPGLYKLNYEKINVKSTVEEKIEEIKRQLDEKEFYIRQNVVEFL